MGTSLSWNGGLLLRACQAPPRPYCSILPFLAFPGSGRRAPQWGYYSAALNDSERSAYMRASRSIRPLHTSSRITSAKAFCRSVVHLLGHVRQLRSFVAGREGRRDVGQFAIEARSFGILVALCASPRMFGPVLEVRGRVGEGHRASPTDAKLQDRRLNGTSSTQRYCLRWPVRQPAFPRLTPIPSSIGPHGAGTGPRMRAAFETH